jgi:hypothetical protein
MSNQVLNAMAQMAYISGYILHKISVYQLIAPRTARSVQGGEANGGISWRKAMASATTRK